MSAAGTRILLLSFGPILALQATVGFAQLAPETGGSAASQQRDGQHDFDFEFGTWKTHLKRLVRPLTGSTTTGPRLSERFGTVAPIWWNLLSTARLGTSKP